MKRVAMLALVVTVASCADGNSPDGGDGGVLSAYTVSGTVAGAGKAKATLTLQGAAGAPQTTTSSDTGGYQFLEVPPGDYTLTVSQKGFTYSPSSQVVKVDSGAVAVPEITSTSVPSAYAVSGTVSGDVKGGVKLTLSDSTKSFEATTDGTGAYSIPNAPAGTYTLTPSLTGYTFTPQSVTVTVSAAAVTMQNFTAKAVQAATYAVSGTVSGDVKGGVKLTLSDSTKSFEATTDGTGAYSIPNAPAGTYTLTPSLTGYTFTPQSVTVTVSAAAVTAQNFTAKAVQAATYAVSGTVSGDVKGGVKLTLSDSTKSFEATTDNTGAYSIPNAPAGTYTLTPSLTGYTFTPQSVPVTVSAAAVTAQNFTAKAVQAATYAVSGTVSGDVKGGVKLTLSDSTKSFEATTDGTGAYAIPNAPAGTYTLTPSLTGYTFTPQSVTVTVSAAAVTAQNFTAKAVQAATYAVSGTVSGDVKGGVKLTLSDSTKSFEATTDNTGAYSIPNAPAGTYTLTPSLTGYTFTPQSVPVTVSAAAVTAQNFTAKAVQAATYAVSGTVSGDVKGGVKLTLSDSTKSFEATTDGTGAYSIPNAPAGTYTLTPSLTGYSFSPASRTVTVAGAAVTGQDFGGLTLGWTARSPAGKAADWRDNAMSSDGKYQVASVRDGRLYTTSDYGATWQASGTATDQFWQFVAMSKDGKYIAAIDVNTIVYTSNDFGVAWKNKTLGGSLGSFPKSIAISNDGKYIAVVDQYRGLYLSSNSGDAWENKASTMNSSIITWVSVTMSGDGSHIAASAPNGVVYMSSNFGATWENKSIPNPDSEGRWPYVSWSGDGSSLVAIIEGRFLYVSKDNGGNWQKKSSGFIPANEGLRSVAVSNDGTKIAAFGNGGGVYMSSDSGDSWKLISSGVAGGYQRWRSVAISDDGRFLSATVANGLVYTYAAP